MDQIEIQDITSQPTIKAGRKLVTVRTIDELLPIEGADAIEVACVEGWKIVVKKGEFRAGDQCMYCEIDSFLPEGNPAWDFLIAKSARLFEGKRGHRLRTIKLRGQVSQGLVLPLSLFPEIETRVTEPDIRELDFSDQLGIVKWEAAISAEMQGISRGTFPSYIQKTDQERCQNLRAQIFQYEDTVVPANELHPEIIRKAPARAGAEYEITLKLDGSSMTAFVVPDEDFASLAVPRVGVASRNQELEISELTASNTFVRALSGGLGAALKKFFEDTHRSIAVQGELMGPGIQGNREGLSAHRFFVFDIFDIDKSQYCGVAERRKIISGLALAGVQLEHVPVLHQSITLQELGLISIDALLAFAEGPSINHAIREGLVFKRADGLFSFKAISNKFLMKEKD